MVSSCITSTCTLMQASAHTSVPPIPEQLLAHLLGAWNVPRGWAPCPENAGMHSHMRIPPTTAEHTLTCAYIQHMHAYMRIHSHMRIPPTQQSTHLLGA